jgi:AAA domain-containing protein/bifunctional DNA primase/polymerase-like protein
MAAPHAPQDRMRAWAHSLLDAGWRLEPCRIITVLNADGEPKKQPQGLRAGWQEAGSSTHAEFDARAAQIGATGYLVVTGTSRLVVADADGDAGMQTLAGMGVPPTMTVRTPHGGCHAYYLADPNRPVANSQVAGPGLDIRGVGGGAFGPGSVLIGLQGEISGVWAADVPIIRPVPVPGPLLAYTTASRPHSTADIPDARIPSPVEHQAAAQANATRYFDLMRQECVRPAGRWNEALYGYVRWTGRVVATQGYASVEEATQRGIEAVWSAMIADPWMVEPDARDQNTVRAQVIQVGLKQGPWTPSEAAETLDGWGEPDTGKARAEQPRPGGKNRRIRLLSAAATKPKVARWLWKDDYGGRIPAGELSVVVGRGGVGKSPFTLWLAARLSRGDLPGDSYGRPQNTLIYATEDDWHATIQPRLTAAGADLSRVLWLETVVDDEGNETELDWANDLPLLEQAIGEASASLLIIDPLINVLAGKADANANADVNKALRRLVALAQRHSVTVVGLAHANKGTDGQLDNVVNGSVAWRNVPRAVLLFTEHAGTGERMISQNKNNLGRKDIPNLTFEMTGHDVSIAGEIVSHPVFTPTGTTDTDAAEALSSTTLKSKGSEVKPLEQLTWLADALADGDRKIADMRELAGSPECDEIRSWDSIRKDYCGPAGAKLFRYYRQTGSFQGGWMIGLTDAGRSAYRVTVSAPVPFLAPPSDFADFGPTSGNAGPTSVRLPSEFHPGSRPEVGPEVGRD